MKLLISLIALAAVSSAQAQDVFLPPNEMVDQVLVAHPKVAAADARIRAAQADARALSAGPHEFELSGSYMRRDVRLEGLYDEFDASLRRSVRLPGKAGLDRRAGVLGVKVAELSRDETRHETALDLAESWFAWISATSEAAVLSDVVAGYERQAAGVKRRVELKDASAMEADQAMTALAAARAELATAKGRAVGARAKLAALYPDLVLPAQPPRLPAPEMDAAEATRLRDLAVTRDHEVKAAEAEVERQGVLTERSRRDRVADPNVGVRIFSERSRDEVGVGVVASMPIGGGRRSAIAEQHLAQSRAAVSELAALSGASRASAESSRVMTLSALESWAASAQALEAASEAARRQGVAYAAGASDLGDLLYAERQAAEAAKTEAVQRAEANLAIVRMRINAHVLWAAIDHDADDE